MNNILQGAIEAAKQIELHKKLMEADETVSLSQQVQTKAKDREI